VWGGSICVTRESLPAVVFTRLLRDGQESRAMPALFTNADDEDVVASMRAPMEEKVARVTKDGRGAAGTAVRQVEGRWRDVA